MIPATHGAAMAHGAVGRQTILLPVHLQKLKQEQVTITITMCAQTAERICMVTEDATHGPVAVEAVRFTVVLIMLQKPLFPTAMRRTFTGQVYTILTAPTKAAHLPTYQVLHLTTLRR